jgi:hypothetical protein
MPEGGEKRGHDESMDRFGGNAREAMQQFAVEANPEGEGQENFRTVVEIDLTRHGQKDGKAKGEADYPLRLTPVGKLQALSKGLKMGDLDNSLSVGSPRQRSQETAGIASRCQEILAELGTTEDVIDSIVAKKANPEQFTAEEVAIIEKMGAITLEHLQENLNAEYDTENMEWITSDPRLDFDAESGPTAAEFTEHFKGGDLMTFLIDKSDREAINTGDTSTSTYTRLAGTTASMLLQYAATMKQLHSLVKTEPKRYAKLKQGNDVRFRRLFGTHASVGDAFVIRIVEELEKQKRIPKGSRDKIVEKIPNGFAEAEGFKFIASTDGEKPELKIQMPPSYAPEGVSEFSISEEDLERLVNAMARFNELCQKTAEAGGVSTLSSSERTLADKISDHTFSDMTPGGWTPDDIVD